MCAADRLQTVNPHLTSDLDFTCALKNVHKVYPINGYYKEEQMVFVKVRVSSLIKALFFTLVNNS